MRITFLNPVGVIGGAERLLLDLLASLRAAAPGAELNLLTGGDGPLLSAAAALGVPARAVPLPTRLAALGDSRLGGQGWRGWLPAVGPLLSGSLRMEGYRTALRRILRRIGPDLVHTNGLKMHLLAAVAVPPRVPVVWHVHDFIGRRPVAARLLQALRGRARAAVAVSRAVAEDLRTTLPGLPVAVVPNAIDLAHFAPALGLGEALDRMAGLPPAAPGTVRVGLVATYARWKGHAQFLRAAARLAHEPPVPLRFYVVGGPIYQTAGSQFSRSELQALAADLGLGAKVGFIDLVADPAPAYRALDVVVHASTQPEPFGLTIAEAMACGRAVIAARAGGAAEIFTDGHDAVGVPPGDDEALAGAVRRLAAGAELRRQLGRNARDTAVRCFDRNCLGPQMLDVYRRCGVNASAKRR